ncbi:FUSC family membrane protein [Vibrio metschnikovii]
MFNSATILRLKPSYFILSQFSPQPHRINEANLNGATVNALNQCKATCLPAQNEGMWMDASDRFLGLYFVAQDIHERASSTQPYRYQSSQSLLHVVMCCFVFKHLLQAQAQACHDIALSIQLGQRYQHRSDSIIALDELQLSLTYLQEQQQLEWKRCMLSSAICLIILLRLKNKLSNVSNPDVQKTEDDVLHDTEAHSIKAMWQRIQANFHRDSLLFRHAVRMSIALTAGYGILQGLDLDRGYWILLTTLFVCQPNYAATRQSWFPALLAPSRGY